MISFSLTNLLVKFQMSNDHDRWIWSNSKCGKFSVKLLMYVLHTSGVVAIVALFKWANWIPLKINCFIWRIFQSRIPTYTSFSRRGIIVSSVLCPLCTP